jgi:hypothetical protein
MENFDRGYWVLPMSLCRLIESAIGNEDVVLQAAIRTLQDKLK